MQQNEHEVYDSSQFEHNAPDGIDRHYWHQARNRVIDRAVSSLPLGKESPILEVGCGRGIVVQYLRKRGFNVTGVELGTPTAISDEVAPHLRFGIPSSDLPADYRQTVRALLFLDLLEHIEDPATFLKEHRELYPNATHCVVTVPARQELFSNYDVRYGHYLRYDSNSMRELCDRAGMSVTYDCYFFHSLYAPTALMKKLGIKRSVEVTSPSGAMGLVHRSLGICFAAEQRLLPRKLPGTSLLAVIDMHNQ